MRRFLLSSALALVSILPARAQNVAVTFEAEVRELSNARYARYAVNGAAEEVAELISDIVGEGYARNWGGWLGTQFTYYDDFYGTALHALGRWNQALIWDEVDPSTATIVLSGAMDRLRSMDAELEVRIAQAYGFVIERAYHTAEAARIGNTPLTCVAYHFHLNAANEAWNQAFETLPREMRYASVIPPVGGFTTTEQDARSLLPAAGATLGDVADSLNAMRLLLVNHGFPMDDPLLLTFQLLADQSRAQRHADAAFALLDRHANGEEGGLERVYQAQMELLDRAAAVLPAMVAALLELERPLTAEDIRPLYDIAVRADQLLNDIENPFSEASNFTRTLAGLRAGVAAMQIADGDTNAHQYLTVIQDLSQVVSRGPTPFSPIAIPAGATGGLINWQAEGLNAISATMDAVAHAIRTGDPRDLQRAIELSENVRQVIHPGRVAEHFVHGAAGGFAGGLPFGRALFGELVDTLAPMVDHLPSAENVNDMHGRC